MTHDSLTILRAARSLIARCGWQPDHLGSPFAGYCIAGAVYEAAGFLNGSEIRDPRTPDELNTWEAATDAFAALAQTLGIGVKRRAAFAAITEWNSAVPQNRDEVLAVFDRAIAALTTGAAA